MPDKAATEAQAAAKANLYIALQKMFPTASKRAIDEMAKTILEKRAKIARFREIAGLQPYSEDSGDTVAMTEVGGHAIFGVNSSITKESHEATKELRQKWFKMVKWCPPKKKEPKHLGHVQSLTHAESHALIRAYERLGKLPKRIIMYVDRKTCNMCKGEMPALLKHLGVDELTIFSGDSLEPLILKAVK